MNIAIVIDTLAGGGAEGVVRRLARGLASRGHAVFIYCLKTTGLARHQAEQLWAAGVIVRAADSRGRDPWLGYWLARRLLSDRIDVVHAHSCAAAVWTFPLVRLFGIPLLHVRHGWPPGPPGLYTRLANRLDNFVDCLAVNCESGRDRLPTRYQARRALCLPNGVDPEELAPEESRRRLEQLTQCELRGPVILSVANIRIEKDIRGLLRAFAHLRATHPQAQLVCVGAVRNAAYWSQVRRELERLRLNDSIHFTGFHSGAARLMPGADVLCLSSMSEGMPNAILEAMAQRLPIVATAVGDVGRLNEPVGSRRYLLTHQQSGLLVSPGDPSALAAALSETLSHRSAALQRAACAAREHARRFTTDHMVSRYERAYQACHRRRPDLLPRTVFPRTSSGHPPRWPSDHPSSGHPPWRPSPDLHPKASVLMLGPAPPQIGGMVTAIDLLMKSPLARSYNLHRQATPPASNPRLRRFVLSSVPRHVTALGKLAWSLLRHRAAILHIHTCSHFTFFRNLLDLILARLLGRKVVLHIRGGQFEQFCARSGRWGRRVIRWGLEHADAVIVLSPSWYQALRPYAPRARFFAVPNAFDPQVPANVALVRVANDERADFHKQRPCCFLYLAELRVGKGLGDLIEAARILHRRGTPFELIIAGPADLEDRSYWEQRLRQAGIRDATRLLGAVTGRAKAELLASADCFVHPSHSEGLPNVLLEAGAAGLPVIATAVGAVPDIVVPSGIRPVPPRDPHSLAREMIRMAADPGLRTQIAAKLQRHIEKNYNLPDVARQIARVYARIRRSSIASQCVPIAKAETVLPDPPAESHKLSCNRYAVGVPG
ncbi:MAG: glycosyltransferase [Planctomycetota bacterium]